MILFTWLSSNIKYPNYRGISYIHEISTRIATCEANENISCGLLEILFRLATRIKSNKWLEKTPSPLSVIIDSHSTTIITFNGNQNHRKYIFGVGEISLDHEFFAKDILSLIKFSMKFIEKYPFDSMEPNVVRKS